MAHDLFCLAGDQTGKKTGNKERSGAKSIQVDAGENNMNKIIFRRETRQPAPQPVRKTAERRRKDLTPSISLFPDREKARIVRKLFRNDLAQFNTFMQELDTIMTWHEVFQRIESEMGVRKIDMEVEEARQLTDRIYLVFFPDDISIGA